MSKRVYIAGPITGLPIEEVRARFATYQNALEERGFHVINPVELIEIINEDRAALNLRYPDAGFKPVMEYNAIMGICLGEMCAYADEVHMLPGWQESKGATLEREVAMRLGIPVKHV